MSKKEIRYKELNTPLVTNMLNMFQFSYGSPDIRGKFDNISVDGKNKEIAPLFSALNAFIITTALTMRMPGQEKIISNLTEEQMLVKIQKTFEQVEAFFQDPDLRSDLIKTIRLYIVNGKFKSEPVSEA
tara:strand:+ start:105 stop:491 length:387 start_codon:yes stop_codon:yes gene_type:complete